MAYGTGPTTDDQWRRRIARRDVSGNHVYYLFADMLGSSNVVATSAGALENESQFYPYGGERVVTQGLTNQKYKFEGKERDPESASTAEPQGLDNFGARFDSSATGRFMSPDWANKPEPVPYAKLGNPQTLNLYAFAGNNPESSPDIDGHEMMMSLDAGLDNGEMDDGSDNFANPSSSSQNSAASPNVQSGQQVQQQMGQDPTLPTEVQPPPPSLMDRVGTALLPKSPLDLALLVGTDGIGDIVEAGAALAKGTEESYSVYRITEEGETTYVGITKRTLAERGAEHGKDLEKIGGGLTKKEARGTEQALLEHHGLGETGGTLTNEINSISRTANPTFYNEAVTIGRELLQSLSYLP